MSKKLTDKQKKILEFIKDYIQENDYAPSLEEVKAHFKLSSIATIHQHIETLRQKGYLNKVENQPRSIELSDNKKVSGLIEIPLLGVIAAGKPFETFEISDEVITIPRKQISNHFKHYALKVEGDSMIDDGIYDGDIVIIREQQIADNGQTVVAVIDDNETTLKKIYREKDRIRLQPANPMMLPIFRKDVEVKGVVVEIKRNLESQLEETNPFTKIINSFPFTKNAKRLNGSSTNNGPKPFLQWVGGKREMIPQYKRFLPKQFKTYYEPFLGGGAMFFHLQPAKAVLGDNNIELIKTYQGVRDNPEQVAKILRALKIRHSEELYEKVRNLDREINIFDELNNAEIAARMIYLNQTGFNALYRVNKQGQFNVPIGSSLNRLICDKDTIQKVSQVLKDVIIKCADFEEIIEKSSKDDFVYLDPPYFPVSKYSDFTRYTKEKFYKEDQERLKKAIDKLLKKKVKVMLSNSDCGFIKNLYQNYKIHKMLSNRSLNCKKDKRGKVSELLITNY